MNAKPSLTVILPAHNAEETIAQAIASTLNQTYTRFELWVLENGCERPHRRNRQKLYRR